MALFRVVENYRKNSIIRFLVGWCACVFLLSVHAAKLFLFAYKLRTRAREAHLGEEFCFEKKMELTRFVYEDLECAPWSATEWIRSDNASFPLFAHFYHIHYQLGRHANLLFAAEETEWPVNCGGNLWPSFGVCVCFFFIFISYTITYKLFFWGQSMRDSHNEKLSAKWLS